MRIEYPEPVGVVDFVPVGDHHAVPRRLEDQTFTYWEDDVDEVILRVSVDVSADGENVTCERLTVEAGTTALTQKLLRQLDPVWFAHQALAVHGYLTGNVGAGTWSMSDPDGALGAVSTMRGRRTVTPALLDAVAAAYQRGGAAEVAAKLHRSQSQAYRLVDAARKAGKLPSKGES